MLFHLYKRLVLVILFILPSFVCAQNNIDSLQQLNEVVIVGQPFAEVAPPQKLSGAQLQRLNSHSVADALRYFAGVQIKDYGGMGGIKTIDVRNMGTYHVGVFYDGIQLGNAQNGVVDLGKFSLDDMDEISLYNGQRSEIFQSAKDYASASSIYLKTRKPRFKEGRKTNIQARYKASSIYLVNPSIRLEQKLSNKFSTTLSSEYIKSDGEYKFRYKRNNPDGTIAYDTTAVRHNGDIEAIRVESGLYGNINDGFLEAKIYYYGSDRGLPGAIVRNKFYNGGRQTDKSFFAQTSYNKELTDNYKFRIKGKFAYDYMHYVSRDTTSVLGEGGYGESLHYDNSFYQQEFYLSTSNLYKISRIWNASLSADFQYNRLNGTMRGVSTPFAYPKRYTTLIAAATSADFGKLKAQASLLATFVNGSVKNGNNPPSRSELTPSVFVAYTPFSKHKFNLRAFYKRIFRMPTFNDMYYTEFGQSSLKPEYTNQYNIGFNYIKPIRNSFLDEISIQTDAYYQSVTDKIISSPKGTSSNRWMMTNLGKVKGHGIDGILKLNGHIDKVQLSSSITYGYSVAKNYERLNDTELSSYGDQIPYTPWHSGSFLLNGSYKNWAFNYSFIYVGKRYDGAMNNIAKNSIQPWYTHDISVQKEVSIRNYKIKGTIEMNNAFNQYYDVVLNYPMPGRTFKFIISINI